MSIASHNLSKVLLLGPLHLNLILLDRYIFRSKNPFLSIPRTIPELFDPPERVFCLLRDHNCIPKEARFVSCKHSGGADTEPDKTVARMEIVYSTPASGEEKMEVFIKLPTARRWSAIAKAAISAIYSDAKEVAFHNTVFPELARQAGGRKNLGFAVPKNLLATWNRRFDRAILIQECVDMNRYHSRPDWMNADVRMVECILDCATDLHRRTWRLQRVPPKILAEFPEKSGVDWLNTGMAPIICAAPSSFRKMWSAIKKRTAREPSTISHGDCRLGNCLFTSDYSKVILTDWEVNSITYYLWDVSYCMICSLTPEDRRKHEKEIIGRYLDKIRKDPAIDKAPSLESAMELHLISLIVVNFFGGLIAVFGGVGEKQGNSENDMKSWSEKCEAAMNDALADEAALTRALDIPVSLVRLFKKDYLTYSRRWQALSNLRSHT